MKLIDLPAVRALPVTEKLELVDELWVSMGQELTALTVTDEEKEALDTRWTSFLENPESALTVQQFSKEMRVRRGQGSSLSIPPAIRAFGESSCEREAGLISKYAAFRNLHSAPCRFSPPY